MHLVVEGESSPRQAGSRGGADVCQTVAFHLLVENRVVGVVARRNPPIVRVAVHAHQNVLKVAVRFKRNWEILQGCSVFRQLGLYSIVFSIVLALTQNQADCVVIKWVEFVGRHSACGVLTVMGGVKNSSGN